MRVQAGSVSSVASTRIRSTRLAPGDAPTDRRDSSLRAGLLATAGGLGAFLLIQGILAAYNVEVVQDAIERGLVNGYPSVFASLGRRLLSAVLTGGALYLGIALVGVLIASRGHRSVFALPAIGYVVLSIFIGYSHTPLSIGSQWQLQCFTDSCGSWVVHPWFGPMVDLALVLLPGWATAVRFEHRRWPPTADQASAAAIVVSVGLVAVAAWATTVIDPSKDLKPVIALLALGLALGTARPWWPWVHVLFAAVVVGGVVGLLDVLFLPEPGYTILDLIPFVADKTLPMIVMVLLASSWQPLAWCLRRLGRNPIGFVIAVNALNIVDAVLTAAAVQSGQALEANPVVRFVGLPVKIALVGLCTWLLYRRRPQALLFPAAAFVWVIAYHLSGIFVNA